MRMIALFLLAMLPTRAHAQTWSGPMPHQGTWVLDEIRDASSLTAATAQIQTALALSPQVVGFSIRLPWSALETAPGVYSDTLLDSAYQIANGMNKKLSVRVMAGRYTPTWITQAPGYQQFAATGGNGAVPIPWKAQLDAQGQTQFHLVYEDAYAALFAHLAAWARAHGSTLLHAAWYGRDYSEVYWGTELQNSLPGGSAAANQQRFVDSYNRLFDRLLPLTGYDCATGTFLTIEFPLSGWGPIEMLIGNWADHMRAALGGDWDRRIGVQANGWNIGSVPGEWGAINLTAETQKDAVWSRKVNRGLQAIQPWGLPGQAQYSATDYMNLYVSGLAGHPEAPGLQALNGVYAEIYLQSFLVGANNPQASVTGLKTALEACSYFVPPAETFPGCAGDGGVLDAALADGAAAVDGAAHSGNASGCSYASRGRANTRALFWMLLFVPVAECIRRRRWNVI